MITSWPDGIQQIMVFGGPRGERGPAGTMINMSLSAGASTSLADRPTTANEGDIFALLGDGVTTFYLWTSGAWENAGATQDAGILGASAKLYPTINDGLIGTSATDLFLVQEGPGTAVYQNVAGSAVLQGWLGEILFRDYAALETSTVTAFGEGNVVRTRIEGVAHVVANAGVSDQDLTTTGGVKLYEAGLIFTTLDRFKAAVARGDTYAPGHMVFAGGEIYLFVGDGNTDLVGLQGWARVLDTDNEARLSAIETANVASRISTLESQNLSSRISTLEGYNISVRLLNLEGLNLDARVSGLENLNLDARIAEIEEEDLDSRVAVFEDLFISTRLNQLEETQDKAPSRYLQIENNLSEVDPVQARLNLGLDEPPEPIPTFYKDTLAELEAITTAPDNAIGYVLDDGANNGTYRSEAGDWTGSSILPPAFTTQPQTHTVEGMIYVSPAGDDAFAGENLTQAVATLERALEIATLDPDTLYAISVYPGIYSTNGHLDVPDNVTGIVAATNSRSTKVRPNPGFEVRNVFRFGDGGYIEGFSFEGWQIDDLDNPTEGFAVSFRPGAIIKRAVFAFNITVFRDQPATLVPPPLDRENGNPLVGNGPGVALADKAVVSQYSVFPQIMLWGATPVCPNGIGYCAKNGAFLNGINAVALWMHKHYMALSGGEIILTNCASQFGDYTLWAEGSTQEIVPAETSVPLIVDEAAADAVAANAQTIIDDMWDALILEYVAPPEAATRKDAAIFLLALEYDLRVGQQESMQRFTRGLFDYDAQFVASDLLIEEFIFSFEKMRDDIKLLSDPGTHATIDALVQIPIDTLNAPERRTKPSKVTSVGHQWNNTMAGVNGRALNRDSIEVPNSIIQRNLGVVTFSGVDDKGKQYFTGGALVNPLTGKFEGPPVSRTINPLARRAAIIAGGQ